MIYSACLSWHKYCLDTNLIMVLIKHKVEEQLLFCFSSLGYYFDEIPVFDEETNLFSNFIPSGPDLYWYPILHENHILLKCPNQMMVTGSEEQGKLIPIKSMKETRFYTSASLSFVFKRIKINGNGEY